MFDINSSKTSKAAEKGANGLLTVSAYDDSKGDSPTMRKTTITDEDIQALFRQVIEQDDYGCFKLLFTHYYNLLCDYAFRFVSSRETAKDIVSEVFYKFWKNRASIEIKTTCRGYLYTAVKNQSYNFLSREYRKNTSLEESGLDFSSTDNTPEETLLYDELRKKIEAAIESLSPQCKTIFLMSRFEGLKYGEIAEKLHISTKAVEAQITRALKQLKVVLHHELLLLILFGLISL